MYGEEFEYVNLRLNWGEERVYYFERDGSVATIPARWTSIMAPDPFVTASSGRSCFCLRDLLELSRLLNRLEGNDDD